MKAEVPSTVFDVKSPLKDSSKESIHKGKESSDSKMLSSPLGDQLLASGSKTAKDLVHQTSLMSFLVTHKQQEKTLEENGSKQKSTSTGRNNPKETKCGKENDKLSSNKISTYFQEGIDKLHTEKPTE